MKVRMSKNNLLIIAETEFEDDYLDELVEKRGKNVKFEGFIKTGIDITEKIGLKLIKVQEK
jgi:hypothetical protein